MSRVAPCPAFSTTCCRERVMSATLHNSWDVDKTQLAAVVANAGGAALRRDLRDANVPRRLLEAAIRDGSLVRVSRGAVALPRCAADVQTAASVGGRATCLSALRWWGVAVLDETDAAHVATSSGRGSRVASDLVVIHRDSRIDLQGSRRVVDVGTALRHAARCVDFASLVVACDSALNLGLLGAGSLSACGFSAGALASLNASVDPRAESPLETLARMELVDAGMQVWPQARVEDVGRVDLLVNRRVAVELDGREYHSAPGAFRRDRARDRELAARGFSIARFAASDVLAQDGRVARSVTRILAAE